MVVVIKELSESTIVEEPAAMDCDGTVRIVITYASSIVVVSACDGSTGIIESRIILSTRKVACIHFQVREGVHAYVCDVAIKHGVCNNSICVFHCYACGISMWSMR